MASKLTARQNGDGEDLAPFFGIEREHETIAELNEGERTNLPPIPEPMPSGPPLTGDLTDPFLSETGQRVPAKSFEAILDGLRTDEDRFYFLIEGGRQAGTRVPIECEEMPLGWHANGEQLTFDVSAIVNLLAIVSKDWSGVMLQPQARGLAVNDEIIEAGRRLRDGDRVTFAAKEGKVGLAQELILVFHEPASLVILDSLMPRSLPHELDPSHMVQSNGHGKLNTNGKVHNSDGRLASLFRSEKEYFGVFTVVELSLMAAGTVVGALIIFLILNGS